MRKAGNLFLDSLSAVWFLDPWMCVTHMENSFFAACQDCMASTFFEALEFTIASTAELSHCASTTFPRQLCPEITATITIGASSFTVMCVSCILATHGSTNHCSPQKAPHPQVPDASDVKMTCGFAPGLASIIADPFHSLANDVHHSMSALASQFRCTNWSSRLVVVDRLISLHK